MTRFRDGFFIPDFSFRLSIGVVQFEGNNGDRSSNERVPLTEIRRHYVCMPLVAVSLAQNTLRRADFRNIHFFLSWLLFPSQCFIPSFRRSTYLEVFNFTTVEKN